MIDFDLIKGRIQKHKRSSIIHNTLELLNVIQRSNDPGYPYWNLLALIKWAHLHTIDSNFRKQIKDHELLQLIELINTFGTQYKPLNFKSTAEVNRSFKIIAYQQFSLQDKFHNSVLSRQIVLYLELHSKFDIAKTFEELTGISIKSFLEYNYFTFFFFNFDQLGRNDIRYEGDLFESYFTLFKNKWNDIELQRYLDLLSIKSITDFDKLHKMNNEIMQLYETNFFTLKPFIFFRNQYKIPFRAIFVQTINHFIYNYMKEHSDPFTEEFGKRMERYVELGFIENNISYLNENALKSKYDSGMTPDFLADADIIIEVKAIELHPRSGVIRTKQILVSELSSSIIKAYTQILSLAKRINSEGEKFGIIITYKEMYLGFGRDAWNEFLQDPVEKFCIENGIDVSLVPPENLFFVSIVDWDHMMQALKSKKAVSLKEMLLKGREQNGLESIAEKKGMMSQVLTEHFYVPDCSLSYLKDKHLSLDIL